MALALAPSIDVEKSQFFLPMENGRIAFSTNLLLIAKSPRSKTFESELH